MSEEILKRIDTLAQYLGTTAEHLFEVLTRIGFAKGCGFIVITIFIAGGAIPAGVYLWRKGLTYEKKNYYDETALGYFIPGAVLLVGAIVAMPILLYNAIVLLVAPEANAMRFIEEILR